MKYFILSKKTVLVGAVALFTFSSCSENREAATTETTMAESPATEEAVATGQVVVQTPDYSNVSAQVKETVGQVLKDYLQVKEALVSSDPQVAQEKARAVLASAQSANLTLLEGEQKEYAEEKLGQVKESASKIAENTNLEDQRENFEPLSEAVFALAKAYGANGQALYYQHCPMALENTGAYWVSTDSEIRNPYFGESMLKCGSTEEVVN